MTTITLSPALSTSALSVRAARVRPSAPAEVAVRTRLRITTRGRRVLAFIAALPAIIAIAIGAVSGTSALATLDSPSSVSFETVVVGQGDTLWGIAQTVAPNADPRDVVDAIQRLNVLPGGVLQAGQELAIPAEYTAG